MLRFRAVTQWATLAWVAVACAQATTINFTATVTSTNFNSFSNGQVVQGSLTFDSNTPGLPQFDGTRIYTGVVTNFQFAGLQLTGPQNQNSISVLPFTVSGFNDVFDAKVGSATSTLEFYLESYKSTGTLGNGTLPAMPFNLAAFQDSSTYFSTYVQFADYANGYSHLDANLTSFNPAAIPEPSSLVLLTLGAASFGAPLLRRLTQRSNKRSFGK